MTRQKKLSIILAGVSFVALSAAVNPVRAADKVINSPADYIAIVDDWDNVIVNADIGGGADENNYGIEILNGATIKGDLINNAVVTANETDVPNNGNADAYATGILVHEGALIEGVLDNNGTIGAYARAQSGEKNGSANAEAHGIAFEIGDQHAVADVYNEAGALISAEAYATAAGSANAHAGGVYQGLEGQTVLRTSTMMALFPLMPLPSWMTGTGTVRCLKLLPW